MTEERESRRERQDNDLIKSLAHRAGDIRTYYWKWIQAEVKQLEIDLNDLIPQCTDAESAAPLVFKLRRVQQIAYGELSNHIKYLEDSVESLKNGATDDLVQDMWQLEDGINYLRGLVRELKDIRCFVDEYCRQNNEQEEGEED